MSSVDAVITFWFGNATAQAPAAGFRQRWFKKSDDFDREIREHFGDLHAALMAGQHAEWLETGLGCLARILVLDQFSRNMFRDTPAAFGSDTLALATTDHVLEQGSLTELSPDGQCFILMPLMHAEDRGRQAQSVEQFTALAERAPEQPGLRNNVDYAHRHKEIVDRFDRYPHRNAILGRESSPEEVEFLQRPGSGF
ncbi:MAG: DUF924 family protein [Nannocystales bacterium]